jgi:hypothetical protein
MVQVYPWSYLPTSSNQGLLVSPNIVGSVFMATVSKIS